MIDLHCHLPPGIDDGPDTLAESIELCRIAVADGITRAVITPHIHPGRWENTRSSVDRACSELQQVLHDHDIRLQLGFAAEVRLTEQVLALVENEDIPFYGEVEGYRIMLLEFPHGQIVPGSLNLVQWLLDRGIRPLIAHPERNRQIMRDVSRVQPFIESGCWLQLTAGSVTGHFGDRCQSLAHYLLEKNLVTVVASDGHNVRSRPPVMSRAYADIGQKYGAERAHRLFFDGPAVIAGAQFA